METIKAPLRPVMSLGRDREQRLARKIEIICEVTRCFCERFVSRGEGIGDRLIQAALFGNANLTAAAGSLGTSKEAEIEVVTLVRAWLRRLLIEYVGFLRTRQLPLWPKDSPAALFVRRLGRRTDETIATYRAIMETRAAEVVANSVLCQIHQTDYLLDRHLRGLKHEV